MASVVNRRRGQAVAGIGSNALKAIKKGQSRRGHHRRRSGPHPDADSFIRHKELPALVEGAQFGADSQFVNASGIPSNFVFPNDDSFWTLLNTVVQEEP